MKIRLKNMKAVRDDKGRYTGVYEWEFSPVRPVVQWIKQRSLETSVLLWWVGALLYATFIGWLIGFDPTMPEQKIIQWMKQNLPVTASIACIGIASIMGFAIMLDKRTERKKRYQRIKSARKLAQRRISLRCQETGQLIEQPTARQFVKERLAKWQ